MRHQRSSVGAAMATDLEYLTLAPSRAAEISSRGDQEMPAATRTSRTIFVTLERQLASQRNELCSRINRHRMEVRTDREPDDEGVAACDSMSKDMLAATLERERRTLCEIESALRRLKKGEYGRCDNCGVAIPRARLKALPWARLCVRCADCGFSRKDLRMAS